MNRAPANLEELIHRMAFRVAATEAAAFAAKPGPPGSPRELRPLVHIRPGTADEKVRAAAVKAFQDIIAPCVEAAKNGAVEVGAAVEEKGIQYCLVLLARRAKAVVGAAAFIIRRPDLEAAKSALKDLQSDQGLDEGFAGSPVPDPRPSRPPSLDARLQPPTPDTE